MDLGLESEDLNWVERKQGRVRAVLLRKALGFSNALFENLPLRNIYVKHCTNVLGVPVQSQMLREPCTFFEIIAELCFEVGQWVECVIYGWHYFWHQSTKSILSADTVYFCNTPVR